MDKKTENSINSLIKILKKEKLTSLKISNKQGSIEISQNNNSQMSYVTNEIKKTHTEKDNTKNNGETINSPMVGVVYLSSKPGSPVFVKKGQKIKKGSTICLIEAMKTFNEIKADKEGIVTNILVKNSEAVEFDQPLIELK
jgi:acetyl-CoA carboxylase biotin carboxyl carrier protein